MKVTLKNYEEINGIAQITLFVERTSGKYNNIQLNKTYALGAMTKNQAISKAWEESKETACKIFNNVWECRNSPTHKVYEDIPEYDEEMNIIWGERHDRTPINEDTQPEALPPEEEPIEFIGFEYEQLPPEPIITPPVPEQTKLWDTVTMLLAYTERLEQEIKALKPTSEAEPQTEETQNA